MTERRRLYGRVDPFCLSVVQSPKVGAFSSVVAQICQKLNLLLAQDDLRPPTRGKFMKGVAGESLAMKHRVAKTPNEP